MWSACFSPALKRRGNHDLPADSLILTAGADGDCIVWDSQASEGISVLRPFDDGELGDRREPVELSAFAYAPAYSPDETGGAVSGRTPRTNGREGDDEDDSVQRGARVASMRSGGGVFATAGLDPHNRCGIVRVWNGDSVLRASTLLCEREMFETERETAVHGAVAPGAMAMLRVTRTEPPSVPCCRRRRTERARRALRRLPPLPERLVMDATNMYLSAESAAPIEENDLLCPVGLKGAPCIALPPQSPVALPAAALLPPVGWPAG